jgi:hypothetical protein
MGIKPTWVRATGQATGVGNAANKQTVSLTVPHRGLIRRIRCRDDGTGSGTPTVAAQVNETSAAGTGTDIVLEFGLTTNPGVDSEESIFYQVSESSTATRVGTLFVTVWTNNAATDHVVDVAVDIEVLH